GFTTWEAHPTRKTLYDPPHFALRQLADFLPLPRPAAYLADLVQQLQLHMWVVFKDSLGSLDGAFQRAGIESVDLRLGEPHAKRRCLFASIVIQVHVGRPASQLARFDIIVDGVANE